MGKTTGRFLTAVVVVKNREFVMESNMGTEKINRRSSLLDSKKKVLHDVIDVMILARSY